MPKTKKKANEQTEIKNGHLLIWRGVDNKERAQALIGCIFCKDIKNTKKKLVETIVAVYGPNKNEKAQNKDHFWEQLSLNVERAKGRIWDLNTRVAGFYQHKYIHKYPRAVPSRGEYSVIDYIIIERENKTIIKDVLVNRGFEFGSDHFLLLAKIKQKRERKNFATNLKCPYE
ncbi:hypothetical protein FQA39_LY06323 [Lamprigera yunnana]|nr:hypothetical protein FQA39_LY06323 [Lamprigera yunnana]